MTKTITKLTMSIIRGHDNDIMTMWHTIVGA